MNRKILIWAMIAVFVLGGLFWGFLSLARPMDLPTPQAEVSAVAGDANLITDGNEEQLKVGKILQSGDTLKTGADGEAEINFFDNAVSRIGPNSEITLEKIYIDQADNSKTNISFKVTVGNVWSRVNQLLDKEASFEVLGDNTVAVVRGTVINFSTNKDGVFKIQALEDFVEVSLADPEGRSGASGTIDLIENSEVSFVTNQNSSSNISLESQPIDPKERFSAWFLGNEEKDQVFENNIKGRELKIIKDKAGPLPGSVFYNLKIVAEKTRTAFIFNKQKKAELATSLVATRLAEAQYLISAGRFVDGKLALEKAREDFRKARKEFAGADLKNSRNKIKKILAFSANILRDITPDMPEYVAKKLLKEARKEILAQEENDYWSFKEQEEYLRDLKKLRSKNPRFLIKYILENKNNIEKLKNTEVTAPLRKRLGILVDILLSEKIILKDEENGQNNENPASGANNPTYNNVTPETTTPAVTKPTSGGGSGGTVRSASAIPLNLSLSGDSTTVVQPNSTIQFKALLTYDDGSVDDVTALVEWTLSGNIGSINQSGLLTVDQDGGIGMVGVFYAKDGRTFEAVSREISTSGAINAVDNLYY